MMKNYYLIWLLPFFTISLVNAQGCPENLGESSTPSLVHFKIETGSCEDFPSTMSIGSSVFSKISCDGINLKYDLTAGSPLPVYDTFSANLGFGICDYVNGELRRETLSVQSFDLDNAMKVYPNPQIENNDISLSFARNITGDVQLFDLTGKLVLRDKLDNVTHKQVSISTLNNGIYMLQVVADGSSTARKIVIMR